MPSITPNLWFDTNGLEAAEFYVSVFPNSKVTGVTNYTSAGPGPEGSPVVVDFELDGQPYTAINGGPDFKFNEAISLEVRCESQEEIDYYWEKLGAGGDPAAQICGWLKDKFGVSWQVIPAEAYKLYEDSESPGAHAAMEALMKMKKSDIAALQDAHDNAHAGAR